MIYIFLSTLFSVSVSVFLKFAGDRKLDIAQIIGFNYLMALGLSFIFFDSHILRWIQDGSHSAASLIPLILLGILLPAVFIIFGKGLEYAGVARVDVAQRLSLILPIIASVTIFGDVLNLPRSVGVGLAFVALLMLLNRPGLAGKTAGEPQAAASKSAKQPLPAGRPVGQRSRAILSLAGIWLGYGVIDILFKIIAKSDIGKDSTGMMLSFGLALIFMLIYCLCTKRRFSATCALWGLGLGVLNFSNICFYIYAHKTLSATPATVFTVMNLGVIILGTIAGVTMFKEKLSAINSIGLIFAIGSILLLAFG